jgi:hypothetical protein
MREQEEVVRGRERVSRGWQETVRWGGDRKAGRRSIINVFKCDFECMTLRVDAFGGVDRILPIPGLIIGLAFRKLLLAGGS